MMSLVAGTAGLYYYQSVAAILPPQPEEPEESLFQFVAFECGSQKFAVEIHRVQEVLNHRKAAPLPEASPIFEGVMEFRGTLVPILDFRKRLGQEALAGSESRILVLKIKKKKVGLLVDRVQGVLKVPADKIMATPAVLRERASGFVLAVASCDEELYMIPDLDRILTTPESIRLELPDSGGDRSRKRQP